MDKTEINSAPLFEIPPAIDPGKINPAGVGEIPAVTEAYNSAIQANEGLLKDLENRYSQPNWFKIAAGFAKPQLGGFLASLASASEAMGENVESQRAIQPTISRMRAQIAASQVPLTQRMEQQRLFKEWQIDGDIKKAGQIYNLDPTSPAAQAVKAQLDAAGSTVDTAVKTQEALQTFPTIDLGSLLNSAQTGNAEKTKNDLISNIASKGYYNKDDLKLKSINDLYTIANSQNNQFFEKSLENAKDSAAIVDHGTIQLQNLGTARQLASSQRLDKLLGLQSGTNAISALFGWIAGGKDGDYSKLDKAAAQLAQDDPKVFADFQILQKSLATNLANAREGIQNPSVASQELLRTTTPDVRMAKQAIIKLLDIQANDINQQLNRARLVSSSKDDQGRPLDPNQIRQSNLYSKISNDSNERKKSILNNAFMNIRLPDFYSPYHDSSDVEKPVVPSEQNAPVSAKAAKPVAKPAAGTPNKEINSFDIKAEIAKRAAKASAGG